MTQKPLILEKRSYISTSHSVARRLCNWLFFHRDCIFKRSDRHKLGFITWLPRVARASTDSQRFITSERPLAGTRRCGYIFYKTFLIPRHITGGTRKGWCDKTSAKEPALPACFNANGDANRAKASELNISWNKEKCGSAEARPQHFCLYKIMYSAGRRYISQSITSSLCVPPDGLVYLATFSRPAKDIFCPASFRDRSVLSFFFLRHRCTHTQPLFRMTTSVRPSFPWIAYSHKC